MTTKLSTTKLSLLLLLALSLLIIPSHCYTKREEEDTPEKSLYECFVKCGGGRQSEGRHLSKCEERCVDRYEQRKQEEKGEHPRGGGGGSEGTVEDSIHRDPKKRYKECQSRCARQERGESREYCQERCREEFQKEKKEQGGEHEQNRDRGQEQQEGEQRQESENPYYFKSQTFDSKYRTEEGHIKVLERFSKRSDLLEGLENYRVAILEANPQTILLPHHVDAEAVLVVVGGKGTINYIWQNQRRSYNLKRGEVIRLPPGSIVYLINHDNEEKFYALKLLNPVNTPGRFQEYFSVGGENPESFLRIFSDEMLQAAFNTPKKDLERLFGQQNKGAIIKATKEQLMSLSQESKSESSRGRKGEEQYWEPINLFEQRPLFQNEFGQHLEASPENHKQLRDLDVSIGYMNIKKGAMTAPYYNSRATKLVLVVGGKGKFEMACPHISSQSVSKERQERQSYPHYRRVSADLSVGDGFVFPAGHPIFIVASEDSDLQLVSFGIKGSFNQKYFLAGQDNVWEQVQPEAKELAFKMPAREVEKIFRRQQQSQFLPGPNRQQREEGKGRNVASILDFAGF